MAAACDLIGVNLYPYFSPAGDDLAVQWGRMMARYPTMQHKIRLTETGWPSEGIYQNSPKTIICSQLSFNALDSCEPCS